MEERTIHGHGKRLPREILAELAEEAGDQGPDFYGRGALIEDFEEEMATRLDKPAAVFLPSGTMAQCIALRIACDARGGRRIGLHPTSHLELHEKRAYSHLHDLRAILVGRPTAPIEAADLEGLGEPLQALLLELPYRELGGELPSWDDLQQQSEWARRAGTHLHLDGARLWEAAPHYGKSLSEIARLFDSVYLSFYKGIGAIAGAILAGSVELVAEARIWIRRHGGNLISLYPYVLSARACLRERENRFASYRKRAREIAALLSGIDGIEVRPAIPPTNMMHVFLRCDPKATLEAAEDLARDTGLRLLKTLRPTAVPGWHKFELSVGDAALAIPDGEIRDGMAAVLREKPA